MRSAAVGVTEYLAEVPAERRMVMIRLRELCVEVLTGYDEGMGYGMPCYRRAGNVEVAFASQKQGISLYVMKSEVVDCYRDDLGGASVGKGCIRFRKQSGIDFDLVRRLLEDTVNSVTRPC